MLLFNGNTLGRVGWIFGQYLHRYILPSCFSKTVWSHWLRENYWPRVTSLIISRIIHKSNAFVGNTYSARDQCYYFGNILAKKIGKDYLLSEIITRYVIVWTKKLWFYCACLERKSSFYAFLRIFTHFYAFLRIFTHFYACLDRKSP
jgi:hypothetical protein